jgi:hypothetical protein
MLVLASCLVMASAQPGKSCPVSRAASTRPSAFDYVVLAGIADSPYLLGMSGYDPTPDGGTAE